MQDILRQATQTLQNVGKGIVKNYVYDDENKRLFPSSFIHGIGEVSKLSPGSPEWRKKNDEIAMNLVMAGSTGVTAKQPFTKTLFRGVGAKSPAHNIKSMGTGTYYSTDKGFAKNFGKVKSEQVTLNKPLVIKDQKQMENVIKKMISQGYEDLGTYARVKGYDGIVDEQLGTVAKSYVPRIPVNDQKLMIDFIDNVRIGKVKDPALLKHARLVAQDYGLPVSNNPSRQAKILEDVLNQLRLDSRL